MKNKNEPSQIKVSLSPAERQTLSRLIERTEKTAGLMKGTVTTSGYVKSVLLSHIEHESKR